MSFSDNDRLFMQRAIDLALNAEKEGNPPVGAVIVLDNRIIGEGASNLILPVYNPRGHAEMNALDQVDVELWNRAREMTCYTTLEPCCMCFGRLLVTGIGRIIYGAIDKKGGSGCLLPHLPLIFENKKPEFTGPIASDQCDPLYQRTADIFDRLMNKDQM
jgi:tRNA(adenine34) deaminase